MAGWQETPSISTGEERGCVKPSRYVVRLRVFLLQKIRSATNVGIARQCRTTSERES